MNDKKITVIVISVLSIGLVLSALVASTYALFSQDQYGAEPNAYSTGLLSIEAKSKSNNITLDEAVPMSDTDGMATIPYIFTITNTGNVDYQFDVKLLSTGSVETSIPSEFIRLQIDDSETLVTFSDLTGGKINLEPIVLFAGESIDISIRIWINDEITNDYLGKSFSSQIVIDGQAIVYMENLVQHINKLYNEADKTVVSNGAEGSKIDYNYASSISLMNDRLGGVTESLDAGNIRYYGANPDNYIDIGDTEIDSNGNVVPTLYRIIGLFKDVKLSDGTTKDLVKVVRNEPIGKYSWDTSASSVNNGYGVNEWSQADLMKLLNPDYDANTGEYNGTTGLVNNSLWWNSGSGNCYIGYNNAVKACDFTSSGLDLNVHNKIAEVVWNTGGHNNDAVYPNQVYGFERGVNVVIPGTTCSGNFCNDTVERTTSWEGKVALMYPSDYGYAVDFNSCDKTLNTYNDSACKENNWIFNPNYAQLFLTPNSSNANGAWSAVTVGYVGYGFSVYNGYGGRPVFYLDSVLGIESGTGKINDPYVMR